MRQYSTYLGNYSGNRLYKVACGPTANILTEERLGRVIIILPGQKLL